jgi:hypothetical protein
MRIPGTRILATPVCRALVALVAFSSYPAVSGAASLPSTAVSLAWDPNPEPVAGYKVHFGTESGSYSVVMDVGPITRAALPAVTLGTTYYLAVSAYDSAGKEGPRSNELKVTAAVPVPPADTTLVFGSPGQGTLQWRYPRGDAPAAESFTVYASEDLKTWTPAGSVSASSPARADDRWHYFEYRHAADKPRMFFRVGASNPFGEAR